MQPHHWRTEGSQLPAAAYNGSLDHAANVHNAPQPLLPVVMGPGKLHLRRLLPTLFPILTCFCAGPALKAEEGVAELRGLSEPAKPASEQCALTSQSPLPPEPNRTDIPVPMRVSRPRFSGMQRARALPAAMPEPRRAQRAPLTVPISAPPPAPVAKADLGWR